MMKKQRYETRPRGLSAFRAFILLASLSLGVLPCGTGYCAEPSLDTIVERLEKAEKEVRSGSFEYSQETAWSATGEKSVSSGSFDFQKPARLRITQKTPAEQVMVSDGKQVWIYTPSYRQVLVDSWKQWAAGSMVPSSLLNFGHAWSELKKKYTFTLQKPEDGLTVLTLIPKKKEEWRLTFWIDGETFVPVRTQLAGDGVTITTKTSGYRRNPHFSPSTFTFTPPPGTETITLP